jgi:hypothetical protein
MARKKTPKEKAVRSSFTEIKQKYDNELVFKTTGDEFSGHTWEHDDGPHYHDSGNYNRHFVG